MVTQKQTEMIMWAIRSLRIEKAEITADAVQKLASLNSSDIPVEQVQEAMEELERRGFQIREYQENVLSNCIVVEQGEYHHGRKASRNNCY